MTQKSSARRAPEAARATPDYLGHLLMQAALRLREETAAALQSHGLLPREFGLLNAVLGEAGSTQAALGKALGIDRTTIVAMLDRLESEGWLERSADPADRRVYRIKATARGRQLGGKAAAAVLAVEKNYLAPLSAAQRTALVDALGALRSA